MVSVQDTMTVRLSAEMKLIVMALMDNIYEETGKYVSANEFLKIAIATMAKHKGIYVEPPTNQDMLLRRIESGVEKLLEKIGNGAMQQIQYVNSDNVREYESNGEDSLLGGLDL